MFSLLRKKPDSPSLLGRLKAGLSKSAGAVASKFDEVLNKRGLDDEALQELEEILIAADLGVTAAGEIIEQLRARKFDKNIDPVEVRRALAGIIESRLAPYAGSLQMGAEKPHVLLIVGVNGSGKTTSIGKIAQQWRADGHKIMVAAGDTFRAAAAAQLGAWAERGGVIFFEKPETKDAAALAFAALEEARKEQCDALILDTAGRLHTKQNLMDELSKIARVLKKIDAATPHQTVLVLDATTGQNAIAQAEHFHKAAPLTGLIITKLDGTARGGVLCAIADKTKLPILAIGVGEGIEDLQPFDAKNFAESLVGL